MEIATKAQTLHRSNVPTTQNKHAGVLTVLKTMLELAVSSGPTLWLVIRDRKGKGQRSKELACTHYMQTLSELGRKIERAKGTLPTTYTMSISPSRARFWKPVKLHPPDHPHPLKNATSILVGSREIDRISRSPWKPTSTNEP